jgi:two-component sensor histidine kinase
VQGLLAEKELLLKEVHHRVKNNMSTVMSLLSLQSESQENIVVKEALRTAMNRLRGMSVLYDKLYRTEGFQALSIKAYLEPLLDEILRGLSPRSPIILHKRIEDTVVEANILSNLGIIVNELMTNSVKHAFPSTTKGKITVTATSTKNNLHFEYSDNGTGFNDDFRPETEAGFGMQLVEMLVKQLQGSLGARHNGESHFVLDIPLLG